MTSWTLFGQGSVGSYSAGSGTGATIGVAFTVSMACELTGIWFYSPAGAAILPGIALYEVSGEVLVASQSPSWSGAPGSGWVFGAFSSPPSLAPSVYYKACAWNVSGAGNWFAETYAYWSTGAGASGITSGPLSAPSAAGSPDGQDDYTFAGAPAYPGTAYMSANWWVDPEVTPAGGLELVQVTPSGAMAAATQPLGPQSQQISNTGGNMLLAVAAWNASAQAAGFTGVNPASSVADSAGNWWRLAADSGTASSSARCAAWTCDSALAVPDAGWWSVALQGYAAGACWAVAEFSGAPAGWAPVIDFAVAASGGAPASSITLTASTAQADWCFALACGAGTAASVTAPGGDWTAVTSGGGGEDGGFIGAAAAWGAFGSAASVSATFTMGGTVPAAGVMIGLSQASYPPAQPNASFPAVRVEAAFGALPGDPSQAVADQDWTDLTSRAIARDGVAGITVSRGRQYELAEPEAGVLTVLMNNVDGALSPLNDASPYAPNVVLGTPVRVSAWWQGRRYPVGYGYVERWPQDWPDLPQWGFSPMVATDAAGAAASANIPSAVQGEILAGGPYACFPFNDQYTASSNTVSGAQLTSLSAAGLIAVNTSRVNQQAAVYMGGAGGIATGQSLSFQGDSGTGMGVSSLGSVDTANVRGAGAVYGPDPGLPALTSGSGASFEFWVTMPELANQPSAELFQLLQVFGQPYIGSISPADLAPGWVASIGVYLPATSGAPELFVQQSTSEAPAGDGPMPFGTLNHAVITVAPGGLTALYLNGALLGFALADMLQGPLTALTFGQASYSYGSAWPLWNYALAYGTVYPYELTAAQVASRWASGSTGFAGDPYASRAGRYLAWANLGLNPAGPGSVPDALGLAAAYGTDGSSLASALNADAQSSGGMWYANANGNLVIFPRPALYGLPSQVTFGDNPAGGEIPYLGDLGLDYDNTYLQNVVQSTLEQGPNTLIAPVGKNLPSIGQYGSRGPLSLTVSGTSSQDAYDAAYWNLGKYSQPQMRVRSLTVDAAGYPPALSAVLSTDISAAATVIRRPVGAPPYALPVITQKVSHSIGPGVWKTAYQLSPYVQEATVLQADVDGQDILGNGPLAWLCRCPSPCSTPALSPRRPSTPTCTPTSRGTSSPPPASCSPAPGPCSSRG